MENSMERKERLKRLVGEDYEEFNLFLKMKWIGPFMIDSLLDNCFDESHKPPMHGSVYLVSRKLWKKRPSLDCVPLYVGSNTRKSRLFRRRVGDLIADMFGFWGHSSGGQSLYGYCRDNNLNPKSLYIGWLEKCGCDRCAENYVYKELSPQLNRIKPPECGQHHGKEKYLAIIA